MEVKVGIGVDDDVNNGGGKVFVTRVEEIAVGVGVVFSPLQPIMSVMMNIDIRMSIIQYLDIF